jgi:hypothetical protein
MHGKNAITRRQALARLAGVAGSAATLPSCGGNLAGFPFDRAPRANIDAHDHRSADEQPPSELRATYFSVGCTLIAFGDLAVMTDPFFTHLPLATVAFGDVVPDPAASRPHLATLGDVRAILVGHAHYDHVLDLPVVAPWTHSDARIFGSQTLVHTFAANHLPRPVRSVNSALSTASRAGPVLSLAGGRLRIRPIRSGHPNQVAFLHLYGGVLRRDRLTPPTAASDYQEGVTIAWLVDFMAPDCHQIAARVYIQTSSTGHPAGFFPAYIASKRPVDLAVVGMDCANIKARGGRSVLDFTGAKTVMFCHWEDFFAPKSGTPKEVVKVDLWALRRTLANTATRRYLFPAWDQQFRVPVALK